MKCPHCGSSMKEEQVFCEVCGKERHLVPVFDAEMAETIEMTMSGIVDDLANTQEIVPNEIESELSKQQEEESSGQKKVRTGSSHFQIVLYVIAALCAVVLLVFVVLIISAQKEDSTYEHQIKMAEEMDMNGDYDQMLQYALKAANMAPNSSDAKMMMAKAYEGLGDDQSQIEILEKLIEADHAYLAAYDRLIALYDKQKRYEDIGQLLLNCKEQEILEKYVSYQSTPPAFSEQGGQFDQMISLKLIAPGNGDVYYTMDGTDPYTNGEKYMTPILMGPGEYIISAYYRNQYGIDSEVVSEQFNIIVETLDEPFVELESGHYDQPQLISVDNPSNQGQIYYTIDGKNPTVESLLYERPIPLPIGKSTFAFALFDEDEQVSDVVYAEYEFQPDTAITMDQIRSMLMQALVQNNTLLDTGGHIAEAEGYRDYKVFSATKNEGMLCFLIFEEYISPEGNVQKTGKIYAVCAQTGECYEAIQNQLGLFEMNKI